jgi:hypothetical protein
MSPFFHSILLFLLSTSALAAGASVGSGAYHAWGERALGTMSFPFLFFGFGLAGFYSVIYLWDRCVPVYCRRCGRTMTKKCVRRNFLFTCTSCGHSQYG